jgi:hypothetical protein
MSSMITMSMSVALIDKHDSLVQSATLSLKPKKASTKLSHLATTFIE